MEPLLKNLTLEAFRGIQNLKLEGLAPVTLIFGANNSGKSSILEAAGLVLRPFDPGQWVQTARQRDLYLPLAEGLWSLFPGGTAPNFEQGAPTSALMRILATLSDPKQGEDRILEADATTTLEYGSSGIEEEFISIRASVDGAAHVMAFRPSESAALGKSKWLYRVYAVTPATHRQMQILVDHLGSAVRQGKKNLAIDLMRVFDPQIQDLDVVSNGNNKTIYVTHAERGMVDLSSFGDGMRQAAALALTLARVNAGALLVDEIESGIHACVLEDVFTKLFKAAADSKVQIIATTHSLEAIDAMIDAATAISMEDSLAGFYVKRRVEGHSARRYSFEDLNGFRLGGRDIR